jgi:hypothetical protein
MTTNKPVSDAHPDDHQGGQPGGWRLSVRANPEIYTGLAAVMLTLSGIGWVADKKPESVAGGIAGLAVLVNRYKIRRDDGRVADAPALDNRQKF